MGNVFAGSEVVEMGIQIEINGRDFYTALVPKFKDRKTAEVFTYLAQEEERHIETFRKILDSVNRYEPSEAYPGEYFAYLFALAGSYVFTQKDQGAAIAKKIVNEQEAIDTGIRFEKDSILFYEGMKKVVPAHDGKTLDILITQEQNHLRKLSDLKKG